VSWNKGKSKWQAQVYARGYRSHLGHYENEAEAARAVDRALRQIYGVHAVLNFPENPPADTETGAAAPTAEGEGGHAGQAGIDTVAADTSSAAAVVPEHPIESAAEAKPMDVEAEATGDETAAASASAPAPSPAPAVEGIGDKPPDPDPDPGDANADATAATNLPAVSPK
jgi:hypothetical protein